MSYFSFSLKHELLHFSQMAYGCNCLQLLCESRGGTMTNYLQDEVLLYSITWIRRWMKDTVYVWIMSFVFLRATARDFSVLFEKWHVFIQLSGNLRWVTVVYEVVLEASLVEGLVEEYHDIMPCWWHHPSCHLTSCWWCHQHITTSWRSSTSPSNELASRS